jgi:arylsulfatase A
MRGGKYSVLEGGTRVPMIISWPARIEPGLSDALTSQLDFVKSFATFFKQPLNGGDAIDSENHINTFLGKTNKGRVALVEQGSSMAMLWNNWKYIVPTTGSPILQPMNIESGRSTSPQLYDLKNDIGERNNLAEKHPDLVAKLAAMLEEIKAKGSQ